MSLKLIKFIREFLENKASLMNRWVQLGNIIWAIPEPSIICMGPAMVDTFRGMNINSEKIF